MVALQIREVPESLRDRLAEIARERGQSLQSYLLDVISDEARRRDNVDVLRRFNRHEHGTTLSRADVLTALRTGRAERDGTLEVPAAE